MGPNAVLVVCTGYVVWTFFSSCYIPTSFFLPLPGRRLDIDRNTVSKGR